MYRTVLVPLDGSAFSESALPFALSIAKRAKAGLHLVHVDRHSSTPADPRFQPGSYLEHLVGRLSCIQDVPVTSVQLSGTDVSGAILAYAEQSKADLLVMSTHGRGSLGLFWVGSVAYELMYRLPLPTLFVRPSGALLGLSAEPTFRRILIPLDGSELAESILEPAQDLGQLFNAEFELLQIIPEIPLGTDGIDAISLSAATSDVLTQIHLAQLRAKQNALNYLEGVAGGMRARGLRVETRVESDLDPGAAILRVASDPKIDLLSLEKQGRGRLSRLFFGSVARKILHGASIPVLVRPWKSSQVTEATPTDRAAVPPK